ncbi:hypothetical protein C4578_03745 [Candidatus Microgenomates bacterium]|jgi:hypothetical protein|nr:MAG: hypothetical protein C4578_03745 [Candidatus Microgenomates bacterium]
MTQYSKNQAGQSIVGWLIGLLIILLIIVVAVPLLTGNQINLFGPGGLGEEEPTPQVEVTPSPAEERDLIDDITQNPANYYGREVTVSSEVEEVIGSRGLVLDSPGILDDDLLVITSSVPGQAEINNFKEGDLVRIMGTVREFNLVETENDLNVDLDDNLFENREGEPVIIANSVEIVQQQ